MVAFPTLARIFLIALLVQSQGTKGEGWDDPVVVSSQVQDYKSASVQGSPSGEWLACWVALISDDYKVNCSFSNSTNLWTSPFNLPAQNPVCVQVARREDTTPTTWMVVVQTTQPALKLYVFNHTDTFQRINKTYDGIGISSVQCSLNSVLWSPKSQAWMILVAGNNSVSVLVKVLTSGNITSVTLVQGTTMDGVPHTLTTKSKMACSDTDANILIWVDNSSNICVKDLDAPASGPVPNCTIHLDASNAQTANLTLQFTYSEYNMSWIVAYSYPPEGSYLGISNQAVPVGPIVFESVNTSSEITGLQSNLYGYMLMQVDDMCLTSTLWSSAGTTNWNIHCFPTNPGLMASGTDGKHQFMVVYERSNSSTNATLVSQTFNIVIDQPPSPAPEPAPEANEPASYVPAPAPQTNEPEPAPEEIEPAPVTNEPAPLAPEPTPQEQAPQSNNPNCTTSSIIGAIAKFDCLNETILIPGDFLVTSNTTVTGDVQVNGNLVISSTFSVLENTTVLAGEIFIGGTLSMDSTSPITVQFCANLEKNSTLVVGDKLTQKLVELGEVTILSSNSSCLNGTFGNLKFSNNLSSCTVSNIQPKVKNNNMVLVFNDRPCQNGVNLVLILCVVIIPGVSVLISIVLLVKFREKVFPYRDRHHYNMKNIKTSK